MSTKADIDSVKAHTSAVSSMKLELLQPSDIRMLELPRKEVFTTARTEQHTYARLGIVQP